MWFVVVLFFHKFKKIMQKKEIYKKEENQRENYFSSLNINI